MEDRAQRRNRAHELAKLHEQGGQTKFVLAALRERAELSERYQTPEPGEVEEDLPPGKHRKKRRVRH